MKPLVGLFTALFVLMTSAACGPEKNSDENPFLSPWETPYGVPPFDKIRAEHFMPAFERAMSLHDAEIDAITVNDDEPTFENVILAYDDAGRMLEQVALVFGMLSEADSNEQLQALQEEVMPRLAAHEDRIGMNEALFAKVKSVYDRRAALGLDDEQLRQTEKTYESFVRAGAMLDESGKAR